jgi:hypothetical protein
MFTHDLNIKFKATAVDLSNGKLKLKIGQKSLIAKCGGAFPKNGSLLKDEYVPSGEIPMALCEVASGQLSRFLHAPAAALLKRVPPARPLQNAGESPLDAAIRVTGSKAGRLIYSSAKAEAVSGLFMTLNYINESIPKHCLIVVRAPSQRIACG